MSFKILVVIVVLAYSLRCCVWRSIETSKHRLAAIIRQV